MYLDDLLKVPYSPAPLAVISTYSRSAGLQAFFHLQLSCHTHRYAPSRQRCALWPLACSTITSSWIRLDWDWSWDWDWAWMHGKRPEDRVKDIREATRVAF